MMAREPERYGHLGRGMPPGPDNPLGARALYLLKMDRIHSSVFMAHTSRGQLAMLFQVDVFVCLIKISLIFMIVSLLDRVWWCCRIVRVDLVF